MTMIIVVFTLAVFPLKSLFICQAGPTPDIVFFPKDSLGT